MKRLKGFVPVVFLLCSLRVMAQEPRGGGIDCTQIISTIGFYWDDPVVGGRGGYQLFICEGTTGVDRVHLTSDDGLDIYVPGGGATTEHTVYTDSDGSPDPDQNPTYTVTYEVEDPPGSGVYVAGAPCVLPREWDAPWVYGHFDGDNVLGGTARLTFHLNNARFDGTRLAHLSGPNGLSMDIIGEPELWGNGELVYEDFLVLENLSSLHEGTYTLTGIGPGPDPESFFWEIDLELEASVPTLSPAGLVALCLAMLLAAVFAKRKFGSQAHH